MHGRAGGRGMQNGFGEFKATGASAAPRDVYELRLLTSPKDCRYGIRVMIKNASLAFASSTTISTAVPSAA